MFRTPRTQQERRSYFAALSSGVRIRAKRNPANLVDAWEDIAPSRTDGRREGIKTGNCWKDHRGNQWRTAA